MECWKNFGFYNGRLRKIMKQGHCPKCGSREVFRCAAVVRGAYDKIPTGPLTQARVDRWVCGRCGYVELWADPEDLENIQRYWASQPDPAEQRKGGADSALE